MITLLLLFIPVEAQAYLDPGTWSFITHVVVGLLVGISYAARVFWRNIKSFFGYLFSFVSRRKTAPEAVPVKQGGDETPIQRNT
jgi:cytochrome b561